jgi:RNA polymerase sigma factor (TIGR02999 family)
MVEVPPDVTLLLGQMKRGERDAAAQLMPLVYRELRKIAGACMRDERPGHTLQPTALVHEAYLKLIDLNRVDWRDRAHFFGVAAKIMRQVLVSYARKRRAAKRGGGDQKLNLDWLEVEASPQKLEEIVAIDEALVRLQKLDARQAQVVEMHYFAGMSVRETAEALGVSSRTVDIDWATARLWLRRELAPRAAQ